MLKDLKKAIELLKEAKATNDSKIAWELVDHLHNTNLLYKLFK